MRLHRTGFVLMVLTVLVAWAFILLKPSRRPDLMVALAGCYRGDGPLADIELVVSPEGVLEIQGQRLGVTAAQDKIGVSLLPDRRITYDPAIPSNLTIGSDSPLLLRISVDRRGLTIPSRTPDVVFKKVACSGATQPRM